MAGFVELYRLGKTYSLKTVCTPAKRPDFLRAAIRIATPRENSRAIATLFFRPPFGPSEAPKIAPFPRFLHLAIHLSKRLDAGALLHLASRLWISLHPRS